MSYTVLSAFCEWATDTRVSQSSRSCPGSGPKGASWRLPNPSDEKVCCANVYQTDESMVNVKWVLCWILWSTCVPESYIYYQQHQ